MTAQILSFPYRPFPTTMEALTDMKIRLVEYFRAETMRDVKLTPVNTGCPYEKILLPLCQALAGPKTAEHIHTIAEMIFSAATKDLTLSGFIAKIRTDDLIMACLQAEFRKLSTLDQLFLINVLKTKFPHEETATELMKVIIFAGDQYKMLDQEVLTL